MPVIEAYREGFKSKEDVLKVTTSSLSKLANNKKIDPVKKLEKVHELLNNLKNEDIPLNTIIAGSAIKVYASTGKTIQLCIFSEKMESLGIKLNTRVYQSAITTAYENGKFDCAIHLLNAAIYLNYLPEFNYDRNTQILDLRLMTQHPEYQAQNYFYSKIPDLILRLLLLQNNGLLNTTILADKSINLSLHKVRKFLLQCGYKLSQVRPGHYFIR